jgi:hypothetical protein
MAQIHDKLQQDESVISRQIEQKNNGSFFSQQKMIQRSLPCCKQDQHQILLFFIPCHATSCSVPDCLNSLDERDRLKTGENVSTIKLKLGCCLHCPATPALLVCVSFCAKERVVMEMQNGVLERSVPARPSSTRGFVRCFVLEQIVFTFPSVVGLLADCRCLCVVDVVAEKRM